MSRTPYLLRARARAHTHTHTRVKELGTSNQQQAKCPRSTCPLTAHFQLARSAKTGARPPGTAASPRVPCPRLCFLNSSSWSPANKRCFPRREDNKNKPPLPAAPPSNFRNYSQLTGMQATGSLQGGPRSGCAEPRWPRTAPAAAAGAGLEMQLTQVWEKPKEIRRKSTWRISIFTT